jgi:hypothetical protein
VSAAEHYGTFPRALDGLLESLGEDEQGQAVILTWAESQQFYAQSLRRFPVTRSGSLDWERCDHIEQFFIEDWPEAASRLAGLVRSYAGSDSLIVITWGNLAVPSIALPAGSVAAHADQVLMTSDDIWLFAIDEKILIEYHHDGRFTVAHVPDAPDPSP